jgi:hypothetical protein
MAKLQKRKEAAIARKASRGPKKKVKKSSAGHGAVSSSAVGGASSVAPTKPKAPKPPKPSASGSGGAGGGGASGSSKPKKQSSANGPAKKASGGGKASGKKRNDDSDDGGAPARTEVTMAQKQELAEKIQHCEGDVLNKAISIIQDSMPGDSVRLLAIAPRELLVEPTSPSTWLTRPFSFHRTARRRSSSTSTRCPQPSFSSCSTWSSVGPARSPARVASQTAEAPAVSTAKAWMSRPRARRSASWRRSEPRRVSCMSALLTMD